jgi:hypothetical protein
MDSLADLGRATVKVQTIQTSIPVLIITVILVLLGSWLFIAAFRNNATTPEEQKNRKDSMIIGGVVIAVGLSVYGFWRLSLRYSKAVESDSTLASFEGAKSIGGALKGLFN